MSVVINLEDGRQIIVQGDAAAVNGAMKKALRSGSSLEIDTPTGAIYINPRQVVSFAEHPGSVADLTAPGRVPEPA